MDRHCDRGRARGLNHILGPQLPPDCKYIKVLQASNHPSSLKHVGTGPEAPLKHLGTTLEAVWNHLGTTLESL